MDEEVEEMDGGDGGCVGIGKIKGYKTSGRREAREEGGRVGVNMIGQSEEQV